MKKRVSFSRLESERRSEEEQSHASHTALLPVRLASLERTEESNPGNAGEGEEQKGSSETEATLSYHLFPLGCAFLQTHICFPMLYF